MLDDLDLDYESCDTCTKKDILILRLKYLEGRLEMVKPLLKLLNSIDTEASKEYAEVRKEIKLHFPELHREIVNIEKDIAKYNMEN